MIFEEREKKTSIRINVTFLVPAFVFILFKFFFFFFDRTHTFFWFFSASLPLRCRSTSGGVHKCDFEKKNNNANHRVTFFALARSTHISITYVYISKDNRTSAPKQTQTMSYMYITYGVWPDMATLHFIPTKRHPSRMQFVEIKSTSVVMRTRIMNRRGQYVSRDKILHTSGVVMASTYTF